MMALDRKTDGRKDIVREIEGVKKVRVWERQEKRVRDGEKERQRQKRLGQREMPREMPRERA